MSLPSFTPGPWRADFDAKDFELDHPGQHPCVYGPDKCIASVGNMEHWVDVWEEWRANARLIAAAPDLFDALKQMYACVSPHMVPLAVCDAARAALSKAESK